MELFNILAVYIPRILNDIWFHIYKWWPVYGIIIGFAGAICMVTICACLGYIKKRDWEIREHYLMRCRECKL